MATSLSRVLGSIPGTGDDTFADLSFSCGVEHWVRPFHYTGATTRIELLSELEAVRRAALRIDPVHRRATKGGRVRGGGIVC